MSLATAIAATSPSLWYKLDEGSGSTAYNSGSLSNNGTITGDVDLGYPGPELGTTAARLFSSGQIVSAAMDLTTYRELTIGLWVAADASAATGTYPIIGIGDVANRLARGPVLWEQHSTLGIPTYGGRWNQTTTLTGAPPEPKKDWHFVAISFAAGTNGQKLYIDGVQAASSTPATTVAALTSDPLLIRSDTPVVVAHVLFWNRIVGTTEQGTIVAEKALWPYGSPINMPPGDGGGGGGGLTEAQAEQLGDIDTKTDDIAGLVDASTYISDTVNVIQGQGVALAAQMDVLAGDIATANGKLDELLASAGADIETKVDQVLDAVTRIFITSAGLGLQSPIGLLLAHPDPNLLHAAESYFYISGQGTLVAPEGLGYSNIYGIRWIATTVPPAAGYRDGQILTTVQRLVQWVLFYPDVGDLVLHPQEIAEFRWMAYTWLWDRPYPNTIQYDVLPGFILRCQYIILAPIET